MKTITGEDFLTIEVEPAETYVIDYIVPVHLNIINYANDDIVIGLDEKLNVENSGVRKQIRVPEGAFVNGVCMPFGKVYITSEGAGEISIVRTRAV